MKRIVLFTLLGIVLAVLLAGGGAALYVMNALKPVEAQDSPVRVTFPAGTSSTEIARMLEQHGLIRNADIFRYYMIVKKEGGRLQAGEYEMKPGMTFDEIIAKMNKGETVPQEVVRFTVPEGFTLLQMADKLEGQYGFNRQTFLDLTNSSQPFGAVKWAADIPDDARLRHRLEGYLFPETYEFKKGTTTEDMVQRMVSELDKKLAALPSDWQDLLKQRGLSFHQLLTVASLIEREVVDDAERPVVASVIYNRMKIGMKLQIDATVQYMLDKPKERLFEKDLQVDSPYNTYMVSGLPPGPIASPSLKSIEAALYPAETKYMFYVTKSDGTQQHYFAETYDQHLKNIAESRKK